MDTTTMSYSATLVLVAGLVPEYENDTVMYPLLRNAMAALLEYLEFMEEGLGKELSSSVEGFLINIGSRVARAVTLQIKAKIAVDALTAELSKRGVAMEGNQVLKS